MNRLFIISGSVFAVIALAVLAAVIFNRLSFNRGIEKLNRARQDGPVKTFSYDQLKGLPEPVQRYFRSVLKEGQKYIKRVKMEHSGCFKTGKGSGWTDITGEQYYTIDTPGFMWRGKTSMFHAWDCYIDNKGSLTVYLLSFIRIMRGEGPAFDQGELLRWLGEGVWYPTMLLPSERVSWSAIDSSRARVSFRFNGLDIWYDVTFNDKGEITYMETMRYMDGDKLEKWAGVCSNYREVNGVKIPMHIEGMWRLKEGDLTYAKFDIEKIEYTY